MPLSALFAAMLALFVAAAGPARADDSLTRFENGVVVELFTAQGCVACPPVEAFFATLADRPDVIALALHVDYWDYIGWKDRFAQPAFTERQKGYARRVRSNTVYTPQMIVGGLDRVSGFRPMEVGDRLAHHAARPGSVELGLERTGERLTIRATAPALLDRPAVVQLVRYLPSATVHIRKGENAGHRGSYRNIVTLWDEVGRWDGAAPLTLSVPLQGTEPVVVILQETGFGPILAAGRLR